MRQPPTRGSWLVDMVVFPNAKINIGLQITEKRADGFHNIESCFVPVGWSDVLEITEDESFGFVSSGLAIPGDPATNLCVRAYQILQKDFDLPPVRMHLHKVVPIGAGLGGGSADAAFALTLLNTKFDLNLSFEQLENYARPLGSDCAFFIQNKPKFCYDKGDQFTAISLDLRGKHLVLVYPNIHISTAEAYAGVQPKSPETDLRAAIQSPMSNWRQIIKNDFEDALFVKYPVLAQTKQTLYQIGATYASMTGSGSTLYGIFDAEPDLPNYFGGFLVWQGKF